MHQKEHLTELGYFNIQNLSYLDKESSRRFVAQ
jgi:hypothetical protein